MEEAPIINSNKSISISNNGNPVSSASKNDSIDEPPRDFKKNRGKNVVPINVTNSANTGGYNFNNATLNTGSQGMNSPNLAPTPPPNVPTQPNPNMIVPTSKFTGS